LQLDGEGAHKGFVVANAGLLAGPGLNRGQLRRGGGPPRGGGIGGAPAVEVAVALGFELVAALDVEPLTAGLVSGLKGGGGWWGLAGIGLA
jgi:hypothetical protein